MNIDNDIIVLLVLLYIDDNLIKAKNINKYIEISRVKHGNECISNVYLN